MSAFYGTNGFRERPSLCAGSGALDALPVPQPLRNQVRASVRLWQSLGFEIVGRLPAAFRDPVEGYVDAFVMYRPL